MDSEKMLDLYIQDYLVKKKYKNSAKAFQSEAQLPTNSTAIDAPGSFLFEWWSVFWDVFIARYKGAEADHEASMVRANEQLQQQRQQLRSEQHLLQQLQFQLHRQQGQHLLQQNHGDKGQLRHGMVRNNFPRQISAAYSLNKEDSNLQIQRDILPDMDLSITRKTPSFDTRASGSNLAGSTSPLKGWPLVSLGSNQGLDQLQPGFSHQRKYQSEPYEHSQLQLRQQIRSLLSGHSSEAENAPVDRRWNSVNNNLSSFVSGQVGLPISSGGDTFLPHLQKSNCSQLQSMQAIPLGPLSENSNYRSLLLDRMDDARSSPGDVSISNSSRDHDQASKTQPLKKRKLPIPFGAKISGTSKPVTPTQISTPSTPSTHMTNDMISMSALPSEDNSSKADLDIAVNKDSVEDDVDSFLSCDKLKAERIVTGELDAIQDITFSEIATINANRVQCCDLSMDGKAIATGGDDNKAVLWCTESGKEKFILEHSGAVTDICFGPRLPRIATSSLDRTVKIWNVADPGCPLRTFVGHSSAVLSLDFHPKKDDIVCSSDGANSIRYWSIKNGDCTGILTGRATQVRFEPTSGRHLAACVENGVSIIDVETMQTYKYPLEGHATDVFSVCWNSSGDYIACISEDSIKVWKVGSWGLESCIRELSIRYKRFHCCIFHPCRSSLLVLGSNESLELWDMAENKMASAFRQPTVNLAASKPTGLVASVSDGNVIKLWK
ncbi:OLC1v1037212C2 [Oldenlandia corymbosa var. corymbosa]|uniref:OLC1v1037212C2 n=1 Tax=Oldenlandia corymbosa var. corymbosa TaxID=529605 RepID=A0AAV1CYB2_OLDCO|nr:OLC1v1037212C2 [Oldenlandia corymbosa var. corymbosa]